MEFVFKRFMCHLRIEHWYDHFGINKKERHQVHCSGHACGSDLKRMIEKIKPKALIPIHTEHPKMFKKFHENVLFVEKVGKSIEF